MDKIFKKPFIMKLLAKIMYSVLLLGFSLALNASGDPTISIRSQQGQSFSLHLKDINNEAYNVVLKDMDGVVLLKEKVKSQDDYVKLFNLKNLPVGDYVLSIENDRKVVLQKIHVQNQKVAIYPGEKKEVKKASNNSEQTKLADKNNVEVNDAVMNKIKWLNGEKN